MSSNVSFAAISVNGVGQTAQTVSLSADQLTVEEVSTSKATVVHNAPSGTVRYGVLSSKATIDALITTALTTIQAPPYGAATGTDTYAVTLSPAPTGYQTGQSIKVTFANTNTGAATINVNGLGAKAIKKGISTALIAGDLIVGQVYELVYNGTDFVVEVVQLSTYGAATGTDTYALTLAPAMTAYVVGKPFYFKVANTNTTAATLNVNALGAKDLKKSASTALSASDLVVGRIYTGIYDGTNIQVNI